MVSVSILILNQVISFGRNSFNFGKTRLEYPAKYKKIISLFPLVPKETFH